MKHLVILLGIILGFVFTQMSCQNNLETSEAEAEESFVNVSPIQSGGFRYEEPPQVITVADSLLLTDYDYTGTLDSGIPYSIHTGDEFRHRLCICDLYQKGEFIERLPVSISPENMAVEDSYAKHTIRYASGEATTIYSTKDRIFCIDGSEYNGEIFTVPLIPREDGFSINVLSVAFNMQLKNCQWLE